jgi:hypothetical protein
VPGPVNEFFVLPFASWRIDAECVRSMKNAQPAAKFVGRTIEVIL